MWKNPKLWAAVVTVILAIVGAFTGNDFKKLVCGEPVAVSSPIPQ